jgi:tRNA uridine 5-carboxymethylaminomethyl modification enzyme
VVAELERLAQLRVKPAQIPPDWSRRVLGTVPLVRDVSAAELLRRPEVAYRELIELIGAPDHRQLDDRLPEQVGRDIEVRASYAGYIERQQDEIERQRRHEETQLPAALDYTGLRGLSNEVRQRLAEVRPATVGQAARVPGVTPAAISILLVHLRRLAGAA